MRRRLPYLVGLLLLSFLATAPLGFAAEAGSPDYRTFFGGDSRVVLWVIAEVHLMFAAFVLGVPIFAVALEIVGVKTGDMRYDRLAHEFTKLLAAAFTTTAAFGVLLLFTLIGLYPKFMGFLTGIFHDVMYVYAFMFFVEAFVMYFYYYSWDRLMHKKWLHISFGILLNVIGTLIMMTANTWAAFMMSPVGIDPETGQFVGTLWQAINTPLWHPINLHRLLGNIAFGGFICGGYAAVKFLGATTPQERAHYDWMGYVGNFVAVCGLIPLPFAGYWLGREIYSNSAVMGNNMMGGAFSWTFIIQAILIGGLFIGTNYYLWIGMRRIPGAERYTKYIKYIELTLLLCFAIWLTPHNLPLSAEEQVIVGGQYHPTLKYLGLMSAKNAVINLMILSTFFSFLLYRRADKGKVIPFSQQGRTAKLVLGGVAALCAVLLGLYARTLLNLDPASMDLPADRARYFTLPAVLLMVQIVSIAVATIMTFTDRGKAAQIMYMGVTVINITFILGVYGYVVMTVANPFLRQIALTQWSTLMTTLLFVATIDVFLYRGAEKVGEMKWGQMPIRSQYTLIFLCIWIVFLIGLMGFIRSGLRENWHVYAVMEDVSAGSWTPDNAMMAKVVSLCAVIFLGLVSLLFWLSSLSDKQEPEAPRRVEDGRALEKVT